MSDPRDDQTWQRMEGERQVGRPPNEDRASLISAITREHGLGGRRPDVRDVLDALDRLGCEVRPKADPTSPETYAGLDPGIAPIVKRLSESGVETFESCDGGEGHAYPEPTVRFFGGQAAGWTALGVAQTYALPINALRRVWMIDDGEPTGPYWEATFRLTAVKDETP